MVKSSSANMMNYQKELPKTQFKLQALAVTESIFFVWKLYEGAYFLRKV